MRPSASFSFYLLFCSLSPPVRGCPALFAVYPGRMFQKNAPCPWATLSGVSWGRHPNAGSERCCRKPRFRKKTTQNAFALARDDEALLPLFSPGPLQKGVECYPGLLARHAVQIQRGVRPKFPGPDGAPDGVRVERPRERPRGHPRSRPRDWSPFVSVPPRPFFPGLRPNVGGFPAACPPGGPRPPGGARPPDFCEGFRGSTVFLKASQASAVQGGSPARVCWPEEGLVTKTRLIRLLSGSCG